MKRRRWRQGWHKTSEKSFTCRETDMQINSLALKCCLTLCENMKMKGRDLLGWECWWQIEILNFGQTRQHCMLQFLKWPLGAGFTEKARPHVLFYSKNRLIKSQLSRCSFSYCFWELRGGGGSSGLFSPCSTPWMTSNIIGSVRFETQRRCSSCPKVMTTFWTNFIPQSCHLKVFKGSMKPFLWEGHLWRGPLWLKVIQDFFFFFYHLCRSRYVIRHSKIPVKNSVLRLQWAWAPLQKTIIIQGIDSII